MIQYNFYKNIVYSMPMLLTSWVSGWSGQTIYNIYLLQIYNVAFTCFPIIVFAVMDLEYEKSELLAKPRLYRKGLQENLLTWGRYFWAMFEATIHGLLIFLIAFVAFDKSIANDGAVNDLRNDGNLCYICVVIAVTFKILFDSSVINVLVLMASAGSVGAYFFFVYTMGLIVELDIYNQLPEIHHFPQHYFMMGLLTFAVYPVVKFYRSMAELSRQNEAVLRKQSSHQRLLLGQEHSTLS